MYNSGHKPLCTKNTIMQQKRHIYYWFAIYTRANSEKRLCEELKEKNIECYLPLRKVLKFWSDRKKWIEEPLFKGYIFVKVSNKEFFDVLNLPGAVCYVSFGGKAQSIPEGQINGIKTLVQLVDEEVALSYDRIRKGQKAEVMCGPLKGVKGEIVEIHGQERILIRIKTMNCSLHAKISKEEVRIIEEEEFAIPV